MQVILGVKSQRKFLLDISKHISDKLPDSLNKIILSKDLTPDQGKKKKKKIEPQDWTRTTISSLTMQ